MGCKKNAQETGRSKGAHQAVWEKTKAMMRLTPIHIAIVRANQSGNPDANGQVPERQLSEGDGNP